MTDFNVSILDRVSMHLGSKASSVSPLHFHRVSKLHSISTSYGIHNWKISFVAGKWVKYVLGCGSIDNSSNWIFSSCLENILACHSYYNNPCSLVLAVGLVFIDHDIIDYTTNVCAKFKTWWTRKCVRVLWRILTDNMIKPTWCSCC